MKNIRLFALAAMVIGILCFGCTQASQNTSKSYGRRTGSAPKENNQSQNGNGQSGEHTPNGPGQSGQTPPAAGGGNDPGTTPPNQNPPAQGEGQTPNPGNPPSHPQQPAPNSKITGITVKNDIFSPELELGIEPSEVLKEIVMITFGGHDGRDVKTKWHLQKDDDFVIEPKLIRIKNQDDVVMGFKDKSGNNLGSFKYNRKTRTFTKVNQ